MLRILCPVLSWVLLIVICGEAGVGWWGGQERGSEGVVVGVGEGPAGQIIESTHELIKLIIIHIVYRR